MIRYLLHCDAGHSFDGWFGSAADYDRQKERGLLSCPECGSTGVEKALMTPSVPARRENTPPPAPDASAQGRPPTHIASSPEGMRQIMQKLREFRQAVIANTEDVGTQFSEEARKIHYGEAEARAIRGQTDVEEAAKLIDEGVQILPIPELPEDKN